MVFSSLVFLCVFFPLQMLIYAFARSIEAKNTVLILFSLVFYAWGEPFYIVLLLFMAFADWAISQGIYKYRGTGKSKAFLVLGCIIDLGLLAFFKYAMFLMQNTHDWFGFPSVVPQIALPIGISFYTFQLLSYMVDVYRGCCCMSPCSTSALPAPLSAIRTWRSRFSPAMWTARTCAMASTGLSQVWPKRCCWQTSAAPLPPAPF